MEAHFREQSPDGVPEQAAHFFQTIVGWKERKAACKWTSWETKAKWNLYFTLKNRLAAMTGTGKTENRNKGQRRPKGPNSQDPKAEQPAPVAESRGCTVEMDFGREGQSS